MFSGLQYRYTYKNTNVKPRRKAKSTNILMFWDRHTYCRHQAHFSSAFWISVQLSLVSFAATGTSFNATIRLKWENKRKHRNRNGKALASVSCGVCALVMRTLFLSARKTNENQQKKSTIQATHTVVQLSIQWKFAVRRHLTHVDVLF